MEALRTGPRAEVAVTTMSAPLVASSGEPEAFIGAPTSLETLSTKRSLLVLLLLWTLIDLRLGNWADRARVALFAISPVPITPSDSGFFFARYLAPRAARTPVRRLVM